MPYANGRRIAVPQQSQPQLQNTAFAPPVGGWVTSVNPAMAEPGTARVCENWFPATTGLKARAGCLKVGTVSDTVVESLMSYSNGTERQLFAASDGDIYPIVLDPPDPDVIPTPVVTGQTSNYYSSVSFATVGGYFMPVVNGTDSLRLYDGTTWQAITAVSTPAITGVATSALSHVNAYRNRLWFVEKGTLNAHYLPLDSIAGAAQVFTLSGTFKRGGSLLFTANWSMDSGDGLDDKIVFASTEGEIAVFQGANPGSSDWIQVGRYDASPPLGKNAFTQVGGDLLDLTEIGIVPMSAIQTKTPSSLGLSAVSAKIQPDWIADAQERRDYPWEIVKWGSRNVAYISLPTEDSRKRWVYAVNLETNAWAKYTNWDAWCLVEHDGSVYFGTSDGKVMLAEATGFDDGKLIYHKYLGHPDHLGMIGQYKTVKQARVISKSNYTPQFRVGVTVDYSEVISSPPNASVIDVPTDLWDLGRWDQALWDNGLKPRPYSTGWVSVGRSGYTHALALQLTSGQLLPPVAEVVIAECTYEVGGLVVAP